MRVFGVMLLLFAMGTSSVVAEHPGAAVEPFRLPEGPHWASRGYLPEWSLGDLTFAGSYPELGSLSKAERYIVAGGKKADGGSLEPWYLLLFQVTSSYYSRYGQMPSQLSKEVIDNAVHGGRPMSDSMYQLLLSPLTGSFPRLNPVQPSKGDVILRRLTDAEVEHFSRYDPELRKAAEGFEVQRPKMPRPVRMGLGTGAYYMRVYGENGVIFEQIVFQPQPLR